MDNSTLKGRSPWGARVIIERKNSEDSGREHPLNLTEVRTTPHLTVTFASPLLRLEFSISKQSCFLLLQSCSTQILNARLGSKVIRLENHLPETDTALVSLPDPHPLHRIVLVPLQTLFCLTRTKRSPLTHLQHLHIQQSPIPQWLRNSLPLPALGETTNVGLLPLIVLCMLAKPYLSYQKL